MKNMPQISEAELEVMKVLWADSPKTSAQIVQALEGKNDWKPKTIQTMITRLVNKGAITVEKPTAKVYLYAPLVTQEQYQSYANQSFLKRLYNGSLNLMLTSFVKEQSLTQEEIDELKQILEKGKS